MDLQQCQRRNKGCNLVAAKYITAAQRAGAFALALLFSLALLVPLSFAYGDEEAGDAATPSLEFSASIEVKDGSSASVDAVSVDDAAYLFLPSNSDTSSVVLNFEIPDGPNVIGRSVITLVKNTGQKAFLISGMSVNLDDFNKSGDVWQVDYQLSGLQETYRLNVMMSANIRSMFLVSDDPENQGRDYIESSEDHSTKATGSMLLVDPDGSVAYNGKLSQIKGRGNSTWSSSHAAKKPYQIKLDKKTDLLETGNKDNKNKTWVLLANAADPTLLKNSICYKLGQALGLKETPECAPIDLYYDGEYRGSYLLSEKVQINSGRVDITSLEDSTNEANDGVDLGDLDVDTATNKYGREFQFVEGVANPEDISGGYLLELDTAYAKSERCWFSTSYGTFAVKEPENLSLEQMIYISEYMQAVLDRFASDESAEAIGELADVDSIARMLLINELCKNPDYCGSSTYFYLPAKGDGKAQILYGGPIWDFDTAFGVRIDGPSPYYGDFQDAEGEFYLDLWQTKSSVTSSTEKEIFKSELLSLLKGFIGGKSSSSLPSFDSMVEEISASQKMNEVLWGITTFGNCETPYNTYQENVDYLKGWITERTAWMESNFVDSGSGDDPAVDVSEMYRLYNPNSGEHFYTASVSERDVLIKAGWNCEGVGWNAPQSSKTPVYRLYSGTDHHYTTSAEERDGLIEIGWKDEGIGWYSDDAEGVPLYRQFNPNVNPKAARNNSGSHNYTVSKAENDQLVQVGWQAEGIGWYGVK